MKKPIAIILAIILCLSLVAPALAANTSGKCGDNLTWSFDASTDTLTISGMGKMFDFPFNEEWENSVPWDHFHDKIKNVVIESGVTSIGMHAFYDCWNLNSVTIPNGVTSIGDGAFICCGNLTSVTIPDSVEYIGEAAFLSCSKLSRVTIPTSVNYIGFMAFSWDYVTNEDGIEVFYSGSKAQWNMITRCEEMYGSVDFSKLHYGVTPYQYVVESNGDNGYSAFTFDNNTELMDLVRSKPSTEYNPRLADFLSVMARSAYDREQLHDNIKQLGFDPGIYYDERDYKDSSYESNDLTVAYSLAEMSNLILITIRGSYEMSWANNANLGIEAVGGVGKHAGFEKDAEAIFQDLKNYKMGYHLGMGMDNTIYVITGHSQGAAAANLLAVKLFDEGVPTSNVYCYTFACPNVACLMNPQDWNPNGAHDNIFNIGNVEDPVTYLPSNLILTLGPKLNPLATWGKFGRSYWFFSDADNHSVAGHDMIHYCKELSRERPLSDFVTYEGIGAERIWRVLGIHCPVDVVVYDEAGTMVAGVNSGEPQYYDSEPGSVLIFTEGDEKWICLPTDKEFDVRMTATDAGEMCYEVYDCNIQNGEVVNETAFESVSLTPGKAFASTVGSGTATAGVKLYVTDATGSPTLEVLKDGTETAIDGVHFSRIKSYTKNLFSDVPESAWYASSVASAYELGLMKGNSDTTFNPSGDVTVAEAITMATRIHSIYSTGREDFTQSGKWYQVYLDYALENGIIDQRCYESDVTQKATRAQFAEIFAKSLPAEALAEMNSVADDAIPDVKMSDSFAAFVYKLYRAGILTGSDANGTFNPQTYITRAEAAAIVSRMAESNNRVSITLN